MNKNICFIINPVSGTGKWKGVEENIKKYLAPSFTATILYTQHAGHATELAKEMAEKCSYIIAVGGDGLINEVASGMYNTDAVLGIIPAGSGNSAANHFGIPHGHKEAIAYINTLPFIIADTALVNGKLFLAVAGTGFDAEVAAMFAGSERRGFLTYIYLSAKKYFTYKPSEYIINVDGATYHKKAFLISIANTSQYGNNAYISPEASTRDGLLDVCILKPFTPFSSPAIVWGLFRRTLHKSRYLEIIRGKNIEIRKAAPHEKLCLHYDGEPGGEQEEIKISIQPKTLKVIRPKKL